MPRCGSAAAGCAPAQRQSWWSPPVLALPPSPALVPPGSCSYKKRPCADELAGCAVPGPRLLPTPRQGPSPAVLQNTQNRTSATQPPGTRSPHHQDSQSGVPTSHLHLPPPPLLGVLGGEAPSPGDRPGSDKPGLSCCSLGSTQSCDHPHSPSSNAPGDPTHKPDQPIMVPVSSRKQLPPPLGWARL